MKQNSDINTPYPVMEVSAQSENYAEPMGSKNKFWFRNPEDERNWLFKFPKGSTGQHWAEKIAYHIACEMKINTPEVQLANCVYEDEKYFGSVTKNFIEIVGARGKILKYRLVHGNQLIAKLDKTYSPDKRYKQHMHTVQRIFSSIENFTNTDVGEKYKKELASYLILDAVICNADRHHENWGLLVRKLKDGKRHGHLAPTFDHASSLGHTLQDTGGKNNRQRYLDELGVEKYVARGRGAIYTNEDDAHAPSPINLVFWCLEQPDYQSYFRAALRKTEYITDKNISEIVAKIPNDWMSATAKKFVIELVNYNINKLQSRIL